MVLFSAGFISTGEGISHDSPYHRDFKKSSIHYVITVNIYIYRYIDIYIYIYISIYIYIYIIHIYIYIYIIHIYIYTYISHVYMHYPIISPDSHGFLSIVPIAGLVSTTAFMALAPDQSCKALDFQGGFQESGALNGEFMANICLYGNFQGEFMAHGKFMKSGRNVISRKSLIGGSTDVLFFHILGMSSSQLTNSYFSEGLKPPTRWQIYGTYVRKYGQILPKNMGSLWEMHQWKLVMNVPPSLFTGGYMFFCCFFPRNSRDLSNTNTEMSLAKHWDWSIDAEKLQMEADKGETHLNFNSTPLVF